ncbi:MAG: DUF3842 family protein [Oscillospiraceae bacterium]|nr:DUF3842 family protein [Oscillospiraceae bacterium]MDO5138190.1 DUF3842 family protein [Oscillospiraceae bacterium]
MDILVIDGQGGNIGRQLVKGIIERFSDVTVTAVGTNSAATQNMLKAGASRGATGENAVKVCAREADVIIGPIGIAVPDSMLGEVTPEMAAAVGQANVKRILIPINNCNNYVVGVGDTSIQRLVNEALDLLETLVD